MARRVTDTVRGFMETQSGDIGTNQICKVMPLHLSAFWVYSCHFECFLFLFQTPFSIFFPSPVITLQEEPRLWQAGQLLGNVLAESSAITVFTCSKKQH